MAEIERLQFYRATIRCRHHGKWADIIRPEAEELKGQRRLFMASWQIDDIEMYDGEWAMTIEDGLAPLLWIASGDLTAIEAVPFDEGMRIRREGQEADKAKLFVARQEVERLQGCVDNVADECARRLSAATKRRVHAERDAAMWAKRCEVAERKADEAQLEIERLRAALHKIAYEPIGRVEATDAEVLVDIGLEARAALAACADPPVEESDRSVPS